MELEEMKKLWQEHDKLLNENKLLNEKLINTLLKDKSQTTVRRMINYEYLGASVCSLLLLVYIMFIQTAFENTMMTVCYFLSLVFIIVSMCLSFYKINMLNRIDLASGTVSDTAQAMQLFKLLISKERLWSLFLSPVLIFTLVVVFARWVRHEDIFDYATSYFIRIIAGSILAIAAIAIVYSRFYFRSIKQITDNLAEIEQFRK